MWCLSFYGSFRANSYYGHRDLVMYFFIHIARTLRRELEAF